MSDVRLDVTEEPQVNQDAQQGVEAPAAPPTTVSDVQTAQPAIQTPVPTTPDIYKIRAPKFKYSVIQKALDETYNFKEANNSTICDIIAMYLKGQKIIYTESKTICEQRLNYLMLPAIFITAVCTILSLVLKDLSYGPTIVSSLNGVNAFLLALINYLKLDAKAEAHRTSAYKFDRLQSTLEFNSGKILFLTDATDTAGLKKIIEDAETTVNEIKSTNQFILPAYIRYNFPRLTNINVFAEVKKIMTAEMMLVTQLRDVLNARHDVQTAIVEGQRQPTTAETRQIEEQTERINALTQSIIGMKDDYLNIDDEFEEEIKAHRGRASGGLCGWLKS